MKKIIFIFILIANFANSMGTYFVEEFNNNNNLWYVNTNSKEELFYYSNPTPT